MAMRGVYRGLGGRCLPCGCVVGVYERYDSRVVTIVDVVGGACPRSEHEVDAELRDVPTGSHRPESSRTSWRGWIGAAVVLLLHGVGDLAAQSQPLVIVPTASRVRGTPIAPESLATALGAGLSAGTAEVVGGPELRLGGVGVTLIDSSGVQRPAPLFEVAPNQITFLVPVGSATGGATVEVRAGADVVATGGVEIQPVAPALFPVTGDDRGRFAAVLVRDAPDGTRSAVPLVEPIALDPTLGATYLIVTASGVRGYRQGVEVAVGGITVRDVALASHPDRDGLDLVTLGPLPTTLSTRDAFDVALGVDGVAANTTRVAVASPPAPGGWGRRPDLLESNSEMSVAALDGKIYVLGGYPSDRFSVSTVQVYDTLTAGWQLASPLPVALNHTMAASVGGRLYVIGGQRDAGGAGPFVDSVYEFDPAAAVWTSRAPMPTARGGGAAAVVDGKIYVAGGRPPRGNDFAAYDPATDRWTVLPPLPTQRNHLGAAAVDGKVFVVGGRFGAGFESERTDRIEVFDPATGAWSAGAPMPRPRGGVNVAEAHGCVHVFGGEGDDQSPSGVFPDHDVYDPTSNTWTSRAPMPVPVHGVTGAVFANGLIYLPGGGTSSGGSSGSPIHQVYRPAQTCRLSK